MSNPILQAAVRDILIDAERDNIRISGLHIDGVEVTQAIQYRSADQHLTDPQIAARTIRSGWLRTRPRGYVCTFATSRRPCSASLVRSWCSGDVTACGWTLACSRRSGRAASQRSRIRTTLMSVDRWRVRSTSLFPQRPCVVTCG